MTDEELTEREAAITDLIENRLTVEPVEVSIGRAKQINRVNIILGGLTILLLLLFGAGVVLKLTVDASVPGIN